MQQAAIGGGAGPGALSPEQSKLVSAAMMVLERWAALIEENPAERVHAGFMQEVQVRGPCCDVLRRGWHSEQPGIGLGGIHGAYDDQGQGACNGSHCRRPHACHRTSSLIPHAPAPPLQQLGLLAPETVDNVVRIMIQLGVEHSLKNAIPTTAGAGRPAALSFVAVDAFVRLIVCLVTHHGGGPPLFAKVAGCMAKQLQRCGEGRACLHTCMRGWCVGGWVKVHVRIMIY